MAWCATVVWSVPFTGSSGFDFRNVRRVAGLIDIVSEVSVVTHVHGLGYSFVEFHDKIIGMQSSQPGVKVEDDGCHVMTAELDARMVRLTPP